MYYDSIPPPSLLSKYEIPPPLPLLLQHDQLHLSLLILLLDAVFVTLIFLTV